MAYRNRKKNYPHNAVLPFENARVLLSRSLSDFPDKIAIVEKDLAGKNKSYTFRDASVISRSLATEFISLGMQDKAVAVIGTCAETVFSYLALLSMGAIAVAIDPSLAPQPLAERIPGTAANAIHALAIGR